mmetsp:Transcript_23379/g.68268  ORF Transcript_23379/g.68268 Transcript_23379/m.68268 type:complete len:447 (-) Transcript_23379:135-1475(-)
MLCRRRCSRRAWCGQGTMGGRRGQSIVSGEQARALAHLNQSLVNQVGDKEVQLLWTGDGFLWRRSCQCPQPRQPPRGRWPRWRHRLRPRFVRRRLSSPLAPLGNGPVEGRIRVHTPCVFGARLKASAHELCGNLHDEWSHHLVEEGEDERGQVGNLIVGVIKVQGPLGLGTPVFIRWQWREGRVALESKAWTLFCCCGEPARITGVLRAAHIHNEGIRRAIQCIVDRGLHQQGPVLQRPRHPQLAVCIDATEDPHDVFEDHSSRDELVPGWHEVHLSRKGNAGRRLERHDCLVFEGVKRAALRSVPDLEPAIVVDELVGSPRVLQPLNQRKNGGLVGVCGGLAAITQATSPILPGRLLVLFRRAFPGTSSLGRRDLRGVQLLAAWLPLRPRSVGQHPREEEDTGDQGTKHHSRKKRPCLLRRSGEHGPVRGAEGQKGMHADLDFPR